MVPRFQVATTYFSCSPPELNLLVTNFIFCIHVKKNHCHRVTTQLQFIIIIIIIKMFERHHVRYLSFEFMFRPLESTVVVPKVCHGHQEHSQHWFSWTGHWVWHRIVDTFRCVRVVEWQENNVVRCIRQSGSNNKLVLFLSRLICSSS